MRVNVAIPESHVSRPVLDAALESVTRLNEAMLANGEVPTFTEGLKEGVRWKPEPPGAEYFDHAKTVLGRKWGDCDDLAPWHAASLRATGEDPDATAIVRRSGPKRWHAIVRRGDGSIDDPSRAAGMGRHEGVVGASLPLMYTAPSAVVGGVYRVRPAIALRGFRGKAQARADMPWHWKEHESDEPTPSDYAMVTLHSSPLASTALTGAIDGALELAIAGGYAHPDHIDRLNAIRDAIEGEDLRDIAQLYGMDHALAAGEVVGSFLKKLAKGATSLVKTAVPGAGLALKLASGPLGKKAISFIPGIGPIASTALDLAPGALAALKKGGGSPTAKAVQALKQASPGSLPIQPMNPFPSVAQWAREGRLCIPATWE